MSVTDPLIKDVKACVLQFLNDPKRISDNDSYFLLFCGVLEKIFYKGLIEEQHTKYFNRYIDVFSWMSGVGKQREDGVKFDYTWCVEKVLECPDLRSGLAKFRLLIKYCLNQKCLHVPIAYLIQKGQTGVFYRENSIIGDEILVEIFLSVLLQLSKVEFNLNLKICSFLDKTWYIPKSIDLELVPCRYLGLSVSFADDRAIVVNLEPDGVAAESGAIKLGDILDKLNGKRIDKKTKGKLSMILHSTKCGPVTLTVIKAYDEETKEFFSPVRSLLRELEIFCGDIEKQYVDIKKDSSSVRNEGTLIYVGSVDVGSDGGVKKVHFAINQIVQSSTANHSVTKVNKKVSIEVGEIGVVVKDAITKEVILNHSFMKMSSCGCIPSNMSYFGYIAGIKNCDVEKEFKCYVFRSDDHDFNSTTLQSIGQGFHRTHYAV